MDWYSTRQDQRRDWNTKRRVESEEASRKDKARQTEEAASCCSLRQVEEWTGSAADSWEAGKKMDWELIICIRIARVDSNFSRLITCHLDWEPNGLDGAEEQPALNISCRHDVSIQASSVTLKLWILNTHRDTSKHLISWRASHMLIWGSNWR